MEGVVGKGGVARMHGTLESDGRHIREHAEALKATAREFTLTEAAVASTYQGQWFDGRDGSRGFRDVEATAIARPEPEVGELPKVSLGMPYDLICDLIAMLTGFDVRAELQGPGAHRRRGCLSSSSTCVLCGPVPRGRDPGRAGPGARGVQRLARDLQQHLDKMR